MKHDKSNIWKLFLSYALSFILITSNLFCSSISVNAATKSLPSISASKYIKCWTLKNSGTISAYTGSDLKNKKNGYWIDCGTDECYIVSFSGKAVKVSYPLNQGGRTSQWFKASDFSSGFSGNSITALTTTKEITTYKRSDGKSTYGYTGKGDEVYVVAKSGSYTQLIYELTSGLYKMGWIKNSDANKYLTDSDSAASKEFCLPMNDISSGYRTWRTRVSGQERAYHVALDLYSSSDSNVYAFANGTVKKVGWNDANGYFIIVEHTISNQTVYSFYAHLKSRSIIVQAGDTVRAGQKIAVVGSTGNCSNGVTHCHFSVVGGSGDVTGYNGNGSYFGYYYSFSGDKCRFTRTSQSGYVFYNPYYIIENGKLPS